jgi:hypothetical protein
VLDGEEFAGASEAGLHLVADEQRPILAAERLRAGQVLVARDVHAVADDRLDDERGDVAAGERALEGGQVVERDAHAVGEQRTEALAELVHAVDRERAVGESVIAALDVHDLGTLGRVARELDRGLDRLRARVAEEHLLEPGRHLRDEALGEQAREHRDVHLHQVREPTVQHVREHLDHLRVIPSEREDAPAGEQIEILVALRVEEVRPARFGVGDVVADRLQHLHDLPVQIAIVQLVLLG